MGRLIYKPDIARSAGFLIRHSHGNADSIRYHIRSQEHQLSLLRQDGRLAEMKRRNIADLKKELVRLNITRFKQV